MAIPIEIEYNKNFLPRRQQQLSISIVDYQSQRITAVAFIYATWKKKNTQYIYLMFLTKFAIIIYMKFERKFIDWEATGNKLYRLRSDNENLRRFVCSVLRQGTEKCKNESGDCENCTDKYIDKSISRPELGEVFGVADNVINNWESGRTKIGIEDLLFYCQIAQIALDDILVYHK